jgi:hypothetical protein
MLNSVAKTTEFGADPGVVPSGPPGCAGVPRRVSRPSVRPGCGSGSVSNSGERLRWGAVGI